MAELDEAREFLRDHHHAVLITHRGDGSLQSSPVAVGLDKAGRAIISTITSSAKARNIRRDGRVSFCVVSDDWFGPWGHFDGNATVIEQPEAIELLVEYYRAVAGEHPDWEEYRKAMLDQGRVLVQVELIRAAGPFMAA
jgi:PPOX class probable F420-dependent enzyme